MYKESNPKIDIFVDGRYKCSTNYSRTNREAIARYSEKTGVPVECLKAERDKSW